jgi:RNA polymerase sigma-70 factor (ECF subfamily)
MSSFSRSHDPSAAKPSAVAEGGDGGQELLKLAQQGDRNAYGRLVVLYQDRIYNAVLRMVGDRDEAAELAQEAFTRALASLESFRGDSAVYTWLFRIAMNLAISRLRQIQRHRVFSLDSASGNGRAHHGDGQARALVDRAKQASSNQPSSGLEERERAEQVLAALGRLDPDGRAVLIMRDVEGFDYQQMADVLSLPLGTLKSRLFRARIALRDELKAYMS